MNNTDVIVIFTPCEGLTYHGHISISNRKDCWLEIIDILDSASKFGTPRAIQIITS